MGRKNVWQHCCSCLLPCLGCLCCSCCAIEVPELSLKQYHIHLSSSELRQPMGYSGRWKKGPFVKLRQLGNWEAYFDLQQVSHIFFSLQDNVRPSSTVVCAPIFFYILMEIPFKRHRTEDVRPIPQPGNVDEAAVILKRNACQPFRKWHSADSSVELRLASLSFLFSLSL